MKTTTHQDHGTGTERRAARRFRLNDPLHWRTLIGDAPHHARMTDVSERGFAFVTCPHSALEQGATIRLSSGPDAGTPHRIAQVRHRGDLELVVMCALAQGEQNDDD